MINWAVVVNIAISCISVILFQLIILSLKGDQKITQTRKNLFLYRKFQHASTALFIVILNEHLSRSVAFWACFSGFLFLTLIEILRRQNKSFNEYYLKLSSSILREEEKTRCSSAFYFLLGTSIVIFFYERTIVSVTVLFIGFGDPFASIFGTLLPSKTIYKEKSYSGFIGCTLACFFSYLVYSYILNLHESQFISIGLMAVILGFLAGLVDFLCVFFDEWDDNLVFQFLFSLILRFLCFYFDFFNCLNS